MHRRIHLVACLLVPLAVGCGSLAGHPLVKEAVEEMRVNTRVAEMLGAPVECGTAIRGTANETDGIASLEFDVKGPKGAGVAKVEGKKTKAEWGVTHLELRPAGGGAKLSLTADLEARTGSDTPRFDPATTRTGSSSVPPPGDIDIVLPPPPGGPGQ
ncbi:MAG: cytochrome c oxidase assembly factor Coa1 family protein [Planctomycetia bacterium]